MHFLRLARLTAALLATALSTSLHAALPGLTITGESFTYTTTSGVVTGRLKIPAGSGPFPAVLLSHGKGGTASNIMMNHGTLLATADLVCIAPDYTHAGSTMNAPDNEGYCPENSRRARACLEILASLGSVDTSRIGAFGHSMGSFLTAGLCGEPGVSIRAAVISAGGTYGGADPSLATPSTQEVQGITAPFLMVHGSTDTTVIPQQSANLDALLAAKGIPRRRLLYAGIGHDIINLKKADIHALLRAWFTAHGVLTQAGNTAPTITAPLTLSAAPGTSTSASLTVGDTTTPATALTLTVFSTNDARLPASSLTLAGSSSSRVLSLQPTAGTSENVELAFVVSDGGLSAATFSTVAITAGGSSVIVNHRPTLTRLADQRTTPGTPISNLSFSINDAETSASALTVAATSSNTTLLPLGALTVSGSGASRTLTLSPAPGLSGTATITLTASDGENTTASAFTLTVAATSPLNTPPVIQSLPDMTLAAGENSGALPLVIKDDESPEATLTLSASSSNTELLPNTAIALGGQNWGRNVTITPVSSKAGRAVLTFTVSDGAASASSACVVEVAPAGNTPPIISGLSSAVTQLITAPETLVSFSVSDAEQTSENLRVTATSSNAALLPDSALVLAGSGSTHTLTLQPTPGLAGVSTVTLSISDGVFTRRFAFLFAVHDPAAPSSHIERPRGLYVLDSSAGTPYTTTFGKPISLRDANIRDLPFVAGYTLRVAWDDIESSTTPGVYDFQIIANALAKLPAGQRLSLIVVPHEPAYIAQHPSAAPTWNDSGTSRACPWNNYLRERRRALIAALAAFSPGGVPLSAEPRLDVIDFYLPGGFTGIRDPNSTPLRNLPGYMRALFLTAVQDELRSWQNAFPGKFVQLGFWQITDNENATYAGVTAWEWLRQQLLAEFNGTTRPRIGFFMENLAARRPGTPESPATGTPVTSFAAPLALSRDSAWTAFQALGSWARPFNDNHVDNTLNGSPSDALEYAFNTYHTHYHELYLPDFETHAYQPALQRWADFLASDPSPPPSDPTPPSTPVPTPPSNPPSQPAPGPPSNQPSSTGGGAPSSYFMMAVGALLVSRLLSRSEN